MSSDSPNIAAPPLDYWHESRRPLSSLVFVAPLLMIYEAGVLLPGGDAARNGVDAWLRALLDAVGFGQYFLLPVLTVCILLGWHHTTRQPWRISWGVLGRMVVECLLLAICLRVLLGLQDALFQATVVPVNHAVTMFVGQGAEGATLPRRLGDLILFLGAGIYEELLFRLILLSAAIWGLRRLGVGPWASVVWAVALTSFIFAAAHYVPPYGEPLEARSFAFRFIAGIFFCILFVYRGFGIAAGTHAGFDILAGLVP